MKHEPLWKRILFDVFWMFLGLLMLTFSVAYLLNDPARALLAGLPATPLIIIIGGLLGALFTYAGARHLVNDLRGREED